MKSIILLAAPAAGKGTEAAKIKDEYGIPHISTGDILREKSKEDSVLGKEINSKISNGLFVSDELIIEILKERIQNNDCSNGYILDGFPRNLIQAKAYEDMLKKLNKDIGIVIVIDIDKSIAASRISGRVSCPDCKAVYNINSETMKPKQAGICDKCGSKLVKRADDTEETYYERYNTYINQTEPLIKYYEEKGILFHIDGSKNESYTHEQVKKILEKE